MVASTASHPLVDEHLAAGGVDVAGEAQVLLLTEMSLVRVRAPHQATHHHAAPGHTAEHGGHARAGAGEQLIGIRTPIGETDHVAGLERDQLLVQAGEIRSAMDERQASVALGPRLGMSAVDRRRRIAPLVRMEEPVAQRHFSLSLASLGSLRCVIDAIMHRHRQRVWHGRRSRRWWGMITESRTDRQPAPARRAAGIWS